MELKIPPVALVILAAILMWLIAVLLPSTSAQISGLNWLGGIFFIAGVIAAISGVLAFRRAKTTVDPRSPGKTTSLVVRGIYNYSRNPMYFGLFLVLVGFCFFLANFTSAVVLPAFILYMNYFQIAPEEKFMQHKFGSEFSGYKKRVRRWI